MLWHEAMRPPDLDVLASLDNAHLNSKYEYSVDQSLLYGVRVLHEMGVGGEGRQSPIYNWISYNFDGLGSPNKIMSKLKKIM